MLKHSSSSMVTTSSNLHSRESSEGRKKLTESLRRPHASRLSSASQYHERHKTYTEKLPQDIVQTVFSRGKQGYSISYTINTLPTSRSRLLFSSVNQTSTGYIIGLPTRSLKETSSLSSKFVRLQVTSFYRKHTSSMFPVKEKPELLTSPVRKGTHTKIFSRSSSTPLLDVGGGLSVFSTGTSVPASYEIVRPSVGFMATSKASNLRTTSIGLKVSLHTGVTPRPKEVNNPTISFGYETISSQVDRKSVLASFSKETIEQPVSIYSRQELVPSSKLSRAERTSSHQYPVDVMGLKSREGKHPSVTLSSASEFRTEPSILLTTPLKSIPSSSSETLNSSMIDIRRIELRLEGYSDITLQSRKKTILLTKNFSASHDSLPFEITETLRPGSSSTMNVLPSRPTSSKVMYETSVLELSTNTTLSQILEIRSESTSVSSTLHLLLPPWQTLTDYLFLHGSSKPIPQTSKLMSSQITDSRKMDASYNMSKLHFLPLRSSPVSIATSSETFARTSLLKPQFQSTFSIEKNMGYKSAFSISGIYESPIVTRKNSDDFASSTSSSLFSLSYMKLSQPLKRNPMTDSLSEKGSLSKTKIAVISERLARTSPTNPNGLFSSANESKPLSLSQEDYPFIKVTEFLSSGQETKSKAAITSKQNFPESSTQATMPLVALSFNTSILPSASSAARIISSPLSDISGSSLSSKEIKSSISLGLTSITETEAMAMSYSKSSLLLRQILFSVMSSELTLSSPSTLSSQYRGVTSAMPGEVGEHMQSSFYPKSSSTKKVKETANLARGYKFHTLSSQFSSQANIKATFIHLESLGSHFPEQLFPSPTSTDLTSTKNMEENIGTLNYLKYPLQKRDTPTSKHVSLTSMPERSLTEVLVHSLKTPLLQSVLISRHLQLSSSLQKEHLASKKFFATPAVYPSSRQFFLGRYDKGRISNTGSLTFSPSSQHIPSSIPHLNSPEHVGVTTTLLYSSRTSCNDSFKTMYEMPSFPPSKTTSEINVESTSSLLPHLSLKFSPDPTSSADAQSIVGQLHSSSMQHITLSNIPPSSSPVQLDTVKSVVGSLKMAPSWETDESPVAARFNSTQISIAIFSENLSRFSSSKQVLASASRPLSSSLKHEVRASVNKAHSIKSSPAGQRTIPLSQQLSSAVKEQDITNRVYSVASLSWKPKLMAENSVSLKLYSREDETLSLPSSPVLPNSKVKSTLSLRESFGIFSSRHGVSTSYVQGIPNPISEITRGMEDSTKPIPVRHAKPLSLASMISSSPDMQSMRSLLVSSTTLSSRNHTGMISSRLTSEKPITSLPKLKTLSIRRENVILVSSSPSGTQFHSKTRKNSLRGFSPSRHEAFPPSQQRRSSLKEDGMKSPMDNSIKMLSHEVMLLSLSYGQEWLETSNLPVSSTSDKQTQSFSSTHSFPSTSSSAEKILQSTTATTHTTNPEGTRKWCYRVSFAVFPIFKKLAEIVSILSSD